MGGFCDVVWWQVGLSKMHIIILLARHSSGEIKKVTVHFLRGGSVVVQNTPGDIVTTLLNNLWCGVVWFAEGTVTEWQSPGCLAHWKMQNGRAVCMRCVQCGARGPISPRRRRPVQGHPGDALPLRLLVHLKLSQCPRHRALASSGP